MATDELWTRAGPIKSQQLPMDVIEQEEERAASTVGEAAPLGLVAFATGTFTVSTVLARWFPLTTVLYATTALFIFAGIAQFIAAMWSYRKGDTLAATAFGSFGGFNVTYALFLWLHQAGLIVGPGYGFGVVSIWFFCWSLIAAGLMVGALYRNLALTLILGWLGLAYGLDGLAFLVGRSPEIFDFGGWAGIASSLIAFYMAFAIVINSEAGHIVLPLGKPLLQPTRPAVGTVVERREWVQREQA